MLQWRINWGVVLSIVFLHFMIIQIGGFPLTFAPFSLLIFLLSHFRAAIRPLGLYLWGFLMVWPFFIYMAYEAMGGDAELVEFSRTYLLWGYAILVIVLVSYAPLKRVRQYSSEYWITLIIIIVFALAQVLTSFLAGSVVLYNPFGEHTYMGLYKIDRFAGEGFARAPGFYLEPSFCAFVVFFLVSSILIQKGKDGPSVRLLFMGFLGIAVIGSATGLLAMTSLAAVRAVAVARNKAMRLLLATLLPLVALSVVGVFLSSRLNEIGVEGSSGYWRLVAPLIILTKVYTEYPLGVPFGQIETFLEPLGLQHGGGTGTSIDNGVYYLAFYFGWLAVPFILFLCFRYFQMLFRGDLSGVTYWWFILFSLQFSGGVLLPEYVFPLALISLQYRSSKYPKGGAESVYLKSPDYIGGVR